jgi:hypothetical protein
MCVFDLMPAPTPYGLTRAIDEKLSPRIRAAEAPWKARSAASLSVEHHQLPALLLPLFLDHLLRDFDHSALERKIVVQALQVLQMTLPRQQRRPA